MKKFKQLLDHKYIFLFLTAICAVLLCYVQFFMNDDASQLEEIYHLDDYELYENDFLAPIGDINDFSSDKSLIVKGVLPTDLNYNSALAFYSTHQNIHIYIDEELVYEFSRSTSESDFGETPGSCFNILPSIYEYRGKEILIHIDSPYIINDTNIPNFYIGDTADIVICEVKNSLMTFATGVVLFILGIASIMFWLFFRKNISKGDLTLYYAGIFCILLAIWTINEQPVISYYMHNTILTTYLSHITLLLIPISLVLLLREFCKTKSSKNWDIILYINYLNVVLSIILQIFNVIDFHNTLIVNIIIFTLSFVITILHSVYITYKRRTTTEGLINFICVILICVGYILYLYKTYTNIISELYLGSICIIIYIMVLVYQYIRRSIAVMSKSDQAEFYENLAYRDSLTGLFNRLAYDRAISSVDVTTASYIVVIFDLNNLKFFNDTYGHTIGDTYIKDSSSLIQQAFKNLGPVYRIGGDEFCILMKEKSIFQYETATRQLDTLVYNYNRVSEILKINIAYGYGLYDPKIDRDIYETRNRADAMMYERKFFMKKNQVPLI